MFEREGGCQPTLLSRGRGEERVVSKGRTYESLGSSNLFGSCCVCVDVGHNWLDEPKRERGKKREGEGGGEQRDLVGGTRWLSLSLRAPKTTSLPVSEPRATGRFKALLARNLFENGYESLH